MAEITVLKQITDSNFQQKVLMKLLNSDGVILLKDKFGRALPLRIVRFDESKFYCKGAIKVDLDFSYSEHYTAHFAFGLENYMFEAVPESAGGHIILTMKRLFHMQNRQTVRYKVPPNANIKLMISSVNEESCLLDCEISDLNSLGCSVIINSAKTNLKTKDLVDATLINGQEGSLQLQGVVRNVRANGPEQFALGIEFHHMIYTNEDKLTSMINELTQKTRLKSS